MAEQQRRLTTIVAMDVAGYSRLMGRNERDTLNRLNDHRAAIDPIGLEHGGRVVGTAGDGILVEFPSVVESVNFALRCQAVMADRNADIPDDEKMLFRIGINLGDVLVQDDDLFGDGVNVAARIEALAEPGGIWVSRTVRDNVRDKLDIQLDDQGEVEVKNIARPVRVFRLSANPDVIAEITPVGVVSKQKPHAKGGNWKLLSSVAALFVILILAGGGYWWSSSNVAPSSGTNDQILTLPTGPKIVVLPFDNLSGDPMQDYFVNGLTEEITTRISRNTTLFVIDRNSAHRYKDKSIDVREIANDLGVRYVVQGSVRRSDDTIRVTAQLISADNGTQIWAKNFDRTLDAANVFGIQDELSEGIYQAIGGDTGAITNREMREASGKNPAELASYECVLLGSYFWDTFRLDIQRKAKKCLERVVEKEPNYSAAWYMLSSMYRVEYEIYGASPSDALVKAEQAAERAVAEDPASPHAYFMLGSVQFFSKKPREAVNSFEKTLSLAPDEALFLASISDKFMKLGLWDRAKSMYDKAIKLNPHPPGWYYFAPVIFFNQQNQYEKALGEVLKLKQSLPNYYWTHGVEAIVYVGMNDIEKAKDALNRTLALKPDFAETVRSDLEMSWWAQPEVTEQSLKMLQEAGLKIPDS